MSARASRIREQWFIASPTRWTSPALRPGRPGDPPGHHFGRNGTRQALPLFPFRRYAAGSHRRRAADAGRPTPWILPGGRNLRAARHAGRLSHGWRVRCAATGSAAGRPAGGKRLPFESHQSSVSSRSGSVSQYRDHQSAVSALRQRSKVPDPHRADAGGTRTRDPRSIRRARHLPGESPHGASQPRRPAPAAIFEVGPKQDPLEVADALGRPMAILRIGSRVPEQDNATGRFLFDGAPWVPVALVDRTTGGGRRPTQVDRRQPRRLPDAAPINPTDTTRAAVRGRGSNAMTLTIPFRPRVLDLCAIARSVVVGC